MTIDAFSAIMQTRIPTPQEFIAFAVNQGWKFNVNGEKASLLADRNDPMAVAFARMLGRQPYRTNVLLALADGSWRQVEAESKETIDRELCVICKRDVTDPENRERLAGVNPFCVHGGNWKEGVPECPYRRKEK